MIYNLYLILILAGLPFFSVIPVILFFENDISFLNIFRILVVLFSIILFLKAIIERNLSFKSVEFLPIYLFLFFYIIRLFHDLFINPIQLFYDGNDETVRNSMFYLLQFFGIVFLPILGALSVNFKKVDYQFVFKIVYITIYSALLISLINQYQNPDLSTLRSTGSLTLSVLLYGHFGVSLILFSIYKLFASNNLILKTLLLSGVIIGILSLAISGSRSPVIALFFGLVYILFTNYSQFKSILILFFSALVLYLFGLYLVEIINHYFPNVLFERLIYAYEFLTITDQARSQYLVDGINEFYKNPILGNAFLLTSYGSQGSYPHNLIIESFMATGILGGSFFTYFTLKTLFLTKKFSKSENAWLCILFIQFFFFAMFSGNLFSSFLFWVLLIIINNSYISKNSELIAVK